MRRTEERDACTRDRLCFLNGLLHQLRQGKDFVRSAYAILKIPQEGHAQLPASLLQADKGVAAARPNSLRVPALIFRLFAHSRMSRSERLL